nr:MAG TPA: hypothetical protein [Caudoviricetes sp.]
MDAYNAELVNLRTTILYGCYIGKRDRFGYLTAEIASNRSATKSYTTDGNTVDVGSEEPFIFTLEDGSTVTKSIRVISTTTSKVNA